MLAHPPGYPVGVRLITFLLAAASASSASLLIRNVNVVDIENGSIRKGVNVAVTGQTISAVGPGIRGSGTVVDGSGKFLIPGLWDMHVHLWEAQPLFGLYVANGVLGIRDMGSDLARTRAWRVDVDFGRKIGPLIYTSGPPLEGPGIGNPKMPLLTVRSGEEARRAVDTVDLQRADFIKVMSALSRDAYQAIAQRARVIRAVFAGHVPESVTVWQAINARQKSMEHLFGVALACSTEEADLWDARALAIASRDTAELNRIRQRSYETFSEARAAELFRRMAVYEVWQTPTLTMRKRLALIGSEELATDARTGLIPVAIRATWKDPREDQRRATDEQLRLFREDYEFHRKLVGLMQRHRVGLLAGTDTGDPYVLPGYALHDELELLVEAGLSPAEALRTATLNPARYFGIEAQSGSVARTKRADLVLLEANPLEDIRNTRRISAVILKGRMLDRKQLDRLAKRGDAAWDATPVPLKPDRATTPRRPKRKPASRNR